MRRSDGTDSLPGSWKISLVGVRAGNSDVSVPDWSLFDAILPSRGTTLLGRLAFRGAPGHLRCIKLSNVITSSGGGEPGRGELIDRGGSKCKLFITNDDSDCQTGCDSRSIGPR